MMKQAGLLTLVVLLATAQTDDTGMARQGRIGSGGELVQDCGLYFEFLGRTGAGRTESFEKNPFGMGYCAGLVRGVVDTAHNNLDGKVCLPENTNTPQVVWAVVQYLNSNPLSLSDQDTMLVLRAVQNAFPCRQ